LQPQKLQFTKLWPFITSAAVILIALSIGLYFHSNNAIFNKSDLVKHTLPAGKNGATLTLSNGRKIKLSGATNGELAREAGVNISKTADGQLVYQVIPTGTLTDNPGYNTLSTARGETYQVLLPDGSAVWLNAASSITYPSSFASTKSRRIKLSGEGYFEIFKDKKHPFIVATDHQEVTVLGTHFNISSYPEDSHTKTTLVEGSVNISAINPAKEITESSILKPGQLATLNGENIQVSTADVQMELAWKYGEFMFRNEPLEGIMRKISRWYNLEIVYNNSKVKKELFGGTISKFGDVHDVLKMLELTGTVHFTIEGRRIIVN